MFSLKSMVQALPAWLFPFSHHTMKDSDRSIQHLLDPGHIQKPESFLFYYEQALVASEGPLLHAMERIKVPLVVQRKDESESEHEFLVFDVKDSQDIHADCKLRLERTVTDVGGEAPESNETPIDESSMKAFFEHSGCKQLLEVCQEHLVPETLRTPVVALATGVTLAATSVASSSMPASAAVVGHALLSPTRSTKKSPPLLPISRPSESLIPRISGVDRATLKAIQIYAEYKPDNAITRPMPAEDRFSGESFIQTADKAGAVVRHFVTWSLTLLQVILLAVIVHEERPNYVLLKDQCFWFSNIMFEALWIISRSSGPPPINPSKKEVTEIFVPSFFAPQGRISGRFRGIKVSVVEEHLLARVCAKFWAREKELFTKIAEKQQNYWPPFSSED